jgi:outer membrane protein TolC
MDHSMKNSIKCIIITLFLLTGSRNMMSQTDSLEFYLQTAAENNPGLKADFLAYQAALQKIQRAGAYDDPQLEMGFFLKPMEIIDGRQVAEFKLMQMFPWFGTKKAAQTEAAHMAKMAFEKFRESRDNLYLSVYTQWFNLCSLQQKLLSFRDNKACLGQLETLALQKYKAPPVSGSSGSSMNKGNNNAAVQPVALSANMGGMNMGMGQANTQRSTSNSSFNKMENMPAMTTSSSGISDILNIQLEMAELDNSIETVLSEIKGGKFRFNALLNRPSNTEIQTPDSLMQIPFLLNAASALDKIHAQNPMLGMLEEERKAYQAKAEMDRKMSYPMFGIGLQYMLINKSKPVTDGMGMDTGASMGGMNGKDMFMPMVSLSIPLYRSKYRAQQMESKLLQQAALERYADTRNQLEAELEQLKYRLDDAAGKIRLYERQADLSQTAYNVSVQEFVSGKSDLSAVIQIQRRLLDFRLKKAEAIANYNTLVANVQKLMSSSENE